MIVEGTMSVGFSTATDRAAAKSFGPTSAKQLIVRIVEMLTKMCR